MLKKKYLQLCLETKKLIEVEDVMLWRIFKYTFKDTMGCKQKGKCTTCRLHEKDAKQLVIDRFAEQGMTIEEIEYVGGYVFSTNLIAWGDAIPKPG